MLSDIRRTMRRLKKHTSGNATLLVALGMPVLIGSSGLAIDFAQWYMWKGEVQFAADQAALAGAWARSDADTRSTFADRARQEFAANLSTTQGITTTPVIALTNYGSGTNNAIRATVSASKPLPFTTFITGNTTTVQVTALATFTEQAKYNACILSVNPTENRSAIFGNAITGGSDCGVGALSTGTQAIVETGDSEVALGDIISAGGIEDTFSNNGTIHENISGLSDPYASLVAPSSSGSQTRTYSCPDVSAGTVTWTADRTVRTQVTYAYRQGNPLSSAVPITLAPGAAGYVAPSDTSVGPANVTSTTALTAGVSVTGPTTGSFSHVAGNGSNRIWRAAVTTVTTTVNNVVGPITVAGNDGIARPLPGIYTDINITCDTQFSSGVYFISGSIDFGQNRAVTGSDVMFVMTGTAGDVRINSTSNVTLTGISASTLQTRYGVTAHDATLMNKMLFFDKQNTSDFDINGLATLDLDGILYMPSREVKVNGNMSTGIRCIMLVSDTFWITGSANLTNFCSPTGDGSIEIGNRPASVRLVA